jgi:hypothetical protein
VNELLWRLGLVFLLLLIAQQQQWLSCGLYAAVAIGTFVIVYYESVACGGACIWPHSMTADAAIVTLLNSGWW